MWCGAKAGKLFLRKREIGRLPCGRTNERPTRLGQSCFDSARNGRWLVEIGTDALPETIDALVCLMRTPISSCFDHVLVLADLDQVLLYCTQTTQRTKGCRLQYRT